MRRGGGYLCSVCGENAPLPAADLCAGCAAEATSHELAELRSWRDRVSANWTLDEDTRTARLNTIDAHIHRLNSTPTEGSAA